jgi:hypothetical protein
MGEVASSEEEALEAASSCPGLSPASSDCPWPSTTPTLPTNLTVAAISSPSESDSSFSIGILSSWSEREGGIARGGRLVDEEGPVDDADNAGAESPSRSATRDRDVVGAVEERTTSPDTECRVTFGAFDGSRWRLGFDTSDADLEWWLISRINDPVLSMSSGCGSKSRLGAVMSS